MDTPSFDNPSLDQIDAWFRNVRRIAILGLSPDPHRPSHGVGRALQRFGFEIVPIRPGVDEILGCRAYASLDELPKRVDVVDVFRAGEHVPAIADDCLRLGIPGLWLQEGVINVESAQRAREGGLFVVMDMCLKRTGRRLGWGETKPHG